MLELSRAMAYKNALAGLDHGGGKAVIIGDPATDKTEPLLRAYGRFVEAPRRALRHRLRRRHLRRGHGRRRAGDPRSSPGGRRSTGGAGDSSRAHRLRRLPGHAGRPPSTSGARRRSPAGRVGVAGVGKVGRHLVGHLLDDGATVVVTDVDRRRRSRASRRLHPGVEAVADADALVRSRAGRLRALRARRRARPTRSVGAAAGADRLRRRQQPAGPPRRSRSCWPSAASSTRPTTCVNSGGVIQVADELHGFSFERARAKAAGIFDTTLAVLAAAAERGRPAGGRGRPAGRAADGRGSAAAARPGWRQREPGMARQQPAAHVPLP